MSDSDSEIERLKLLHYTLIVRRRSVKGQVAKFRNYLKAINESDCTDLKVYNELSSKLTNFERMLERFDEIQSRIEELNGVIESRVKQAEGSRIDP